MALYFERIAGPAGPTLIFLHHGLGSIAQWRDFPAKLCAAAGSAGFVFDRLGHGRSPQSSGRGPLYLFEEAQRLDELLRLHDFQDFILVGHSDGGSIALLYATLADVVQPRAIVTIAAHTFVEDVTRAGIRAAVDESRLLIPKLRRMHGEKASTLFWDWAGAWLSPTFDSFDIRARMGDVRCPVLAVQGDNDEYGTVAQLESLVENCSGPVRTVLIPGAAHEPHLQAPEATLSAISAWLPG